MIGPIVGIVLIVIAWGLLGVAYAKSDGPKEWLRKEDDRG
jgi:hypothetical protein